MHLKVITDALILKKNRYTKTLKRFKELFRSVSIIQRNQFPVPLAAVLLFPKMRW